MFKSCGFHPWLRKIPWRRNWQPTPVFLPGKSHGLRSLAGYSPWGHKESDMTEVTAHKEKVEEAGEVSIARGASGDDNCAFTTGPSLLGGSHPISGRLAPCRRGQARSGWPPVRCASPLSGFQQRVVGKSSSAGDLHHGLMRDSRERMLNTPRPAGPQIPGR